MMLHLIFLALGLTFCTAGSVISWDRGEALLLSNALAALLVGMGVLCILIGALL